MAPNKSISCRSGASLPSPGSSLPITLGRSAFISSSHSINLQMLTSASRHFTDEEKKDTFVRVVAPAFAMGISLEREAPGPAPVHSPLSLYASLISLGTTLSHTLEKKEPARKAYIHVVQTSGYNTNEATGATVRVSAEGAGELLLKEGDGVYVLGLPGSELKVGIVGESVAEVLLFEME